jgi:hypothetical protein
VRKARDKVSKGRTKRSEVKTRLRSAAMQYAGLIFPSLPSAIVTHGTTGRVNNYRGISKNERSE